ncbi:MAG: D-glycero-beta-D-manno-heptose 1-phosphate adenylyltransferase [Spirochaetia bacterium]|nr:D-glycero-beta-D-manno-heptose 1-phosphate adenylyltransferase [Spirochaetia bacterium]
MHSSYKEKLFQNTIQNLRKQKKKIVFTNGCFDILHSGHLQYLWQASKLGDALVVAANSDDSVKRLKGKSRPVNTLKDRLLSLSALPFTSVITSFSEDTPIEIIKKIKPDIHVKGGDYKKEDLPEYSVIKKYKGEVVILPFRKGYSTTDIIKKTK